MSSKRKRDDETETPSRLTSRARRALGEGSSTLVTPRNQLASRAARTSSPEGSNVPFTTIGSQSRPDRPLASSFFDPENPNTQTQGEDTTLRDASIHTIDSTEGPDYNSTEDCFTKSFSFALFDFLWPETTWPRYGSLTRDLEVMELSDHSMTAPDGVIYERSKLREMSTLLDGTKVEVIVGRDKTRFLISEDLLCLSPYFKAVFRGSFLESSTKRSILPDISPVAFRFVIEALIISGFNKSKIWSFSDTRPSGKPHTTVENRRNLAIWFHIVYITDLLQLPKLQMEAETEISTLLKDDYSFIKKSYLEELVQVDRHGNIISHLRHSTSASKRSASLTQETLLDIYSKTPPDASLREIVKQHTFTAIIDKLAKVEKYEMFLVENPEVGVEWMMGMQSKLR